MAAVGEVDRRQRDGYRAGEHQRDQRQVHTAHPQRRQPDEAAQHHRDQPRDQQHDLERQRGREQQPGRDPGAHREHRRLAERDEADAADEHVEAERDDRVDRDLGAGVDVVEADERGDREQDQEQQSEDHRRPDQRARLHAARGQRPSGAPDARRRHRSRSPSGRSRSRAFGWRSGARSRRARTAPCRGSWRNPDSGWPRSPHRRRRSRARR